MKNHKISGEKEELKKKKARSSGRKNKKNQYKNKRKKEGIMEEKVVAQGTSKKNQCRCLDVLEAIIRKISKGMF